MKIYLIRTFTDCCFRICSSPFLLQSNSNDLKILLLQNGYPNSVINNNINHVINKHQNRPKEPYATVPKKEIFVFLPFLGLQSRAVSQQLKFWVRKFYSCFDLKIIFSNTRNIKSFFPYKDKVCHYFMSKIVYIGKM